MLLDILVSISILSLNILLFYYLYFFTNLITFKSYNNNFCKPISIIICAKNESENLSSNLPLILNQDYFNFEVIVVNDQSIDGTYDLLEKLKKKYNNLVAVNIDQHISSREGKKFALTIGIKTAKYEHLLLTDADCKPKSRKWAKEMCSNFNHSDIILGYGSYKKKAGLLNQIIRFDTFNIAIQYLSYALKGYTYMGVGRNIAYKKSLFFDNKGFANHIHIPSGDDDLFIQEVATRNNVCIVMSENSHTISEVMENWKKWSFQKRRHITTGPLYKIKYKILLAIYPLAQFLFWISLIFLFALKSEWCIILLCIKLVTTYIIYFKPMKNLKAFDLYWMHPLYEIFQLFIQGFFVLLNLFSNPKKWSR